jgi:hypothetical protein
MFFWRGHKKNSDQDIDKNSSKMCYTKFIISKTENKWSVYIPGDVIQTVNYVLNRSKLVLNSFMMFRV